MTSKINITAIVTAFAVLAALLLGTVALAPVASAEGPPPLPGADELPAPPADESTPPVEEAPPEDENPGKDDPPIIEEAPKVAPSVLKARVAGKKLVLKLQCTEAGTVALKGSRAKSFRCASGKGSAALRLSRRQLRRANRSGLRVALLIRAGGETTTLPLKIARRPKGQVASSSMTTWNFVSADCAAYSSRGGEGAHFGITTTTSNGFGAAAGETVYWASYVYLYRNGSWSRYAHDWERYNVTSNSTGSYGDGYHIVGGGLGYGIGISQTWRIPSGYWAVSGIYTWSQRTGYRFAWVGNVQTFGYVQTSGPYCFPY